MLASPRRGVGMISFSKRSCSEYSMLELSGDDALHKPQLESFCPSNFEWQLLHVAQRPPQEVLAGHGYRDDFDCALDATRNARRARHVIDENQLAAGAQHARHLVERGVDVWYGAQPEGADDGVERRVDERQRMRVALAKLDITPQLGRARSGDRQHRLAQIDTS